MRPVSAFNLLSFYKFLHCIWRKANHFHRLLPHVVRSFEIVCFFRRICRTTFVRNESTNWPLIWFQLLAVFRYLRICGREQCTSRTCSRRIILSFSICFEQYSFLSRVILKLLKTYSANIYEVIRQREHVLIINAPKVLKM